MVSTAERVAVLGQRKGMQVPYVPRCVEVGKTYFVICKHLTLRDLLGIFSFKMYLQSWVGVAHAFSPVL